MFFGGGRDHKPGWSRSGLEVDGNTIRQLRVHVKVQNNSKIKEGTTIRGGYN